MMILKIKDREVLAKVERIIMKEFATEREYDFAVWEYFFRPYELWKFQEELYKTYYGFLVYKNLLFIVDEGRYVVYDLDTEEKVEEFVITYPTEKENEVSSNNFDKKIEEIVKKYTESD